MVERSDPAPVAAFFAPDGFTSGSPVTLGEDAAQDLEEEHASGHGPSHRQRGAQCSVLRTGCCDEQQQEIRAAGIGNAC